MAAMGPSFCGRRKSGAFLSNERWGPDLVVISGFFARDALLMLADTVEKLLRHRHDPTPPCAGHVSAFGFRRAGAVVPPAGRAAAAA